MSERLVRAKNGLFTLYKDEQAIHSLYDPALEAGRYINSLSLGEEGKMEACRWFILIEPGLGYLIPVLKKKFPAAGVIALHCSAFFDAYPVETAAASWSPASPSGLEDFLEDHIRDAGPEEVRVIEWRPAAAAWGREFVSLLERTVRFLRRSSANRATVRAFGRRWLRNALRNLGLPRRRAVPSPADFFRRPIVLCASGPSLEGDLEKIAAWKASASPPLIMAVSSAAACLASAGIIPGIVVSTDGGAWALFHIVEALRLSAAEKPFFALSLTAALPSQMSEETVLLLADGSLWQRRLLRSLGLPFLVFPQRGTVSASALDLALFLTGEAGLPVYLSGLDLRHQDLAAHCRPYTFDRFRDESACRQRPAYSQAFERAGMIREGGALTVYESWFRKELEKYPKRLWTLGENSLGIPRASWKTPGLSSKREKKRAPLKRPPESPGLSPAFAVDCLVKALHDPAEGKQIAAELGELLFPATDLSDIKNELRTMRKITQN